MSDNRVTISNDLSQYADEIEAIRREQAAAEQNNTTTKIRQKKAPATEQPEAVSLADINVGQIGSGKAAEELRKKADDALNYRNSVSAQEEHDERVSELQEYNRTGGRGMMPISVSTLPTKGMFYPVGTQIHIKAASLGDLRAWSSADDTDLSAIDDAINEIMSSCVNISFPADNTIKYANYKDLKDIDRLYLILAVHDYTFPPEKGNDIKVTINETKDVVVRKDNVEFVKFGDKLMKYYNAEKRCFSFPTKAPSFQGGYLNVYIPCVGVTKWLKDYARTRQQRQEGFDKDFIGIAALLIPDHRGLNNDKYLDLIDSTADWTAYEWALINKVKKVIESAVTPKLLYKDEAGSEKEAPLNFRGGIKSLLEPNLDIDL